MLQLKTAVNAGKEILKIYQHEGLFEKSDNNPLNEVDLAVHQLIVQRLQNPAPDIPILSKESASILWSEQKK